MSKEWKVTITDDSTKLTEFIWDGTRFTIFTRYKGNGNKPDKIEFFSPIEMAKIVRPAKDELIRLWHEEKNGYVKEKLADGLIMGEKQR